MKRFVRVPHPTAEVERQAQLVHHPTAETGRRRSTHWQKLQRMVGNHALNRQMSSVSRAVRSPGKPLNDGVRVGMEQRFAHDFSNVRVHTDEQASESARTLQARAYTWGQDVVFGEGEYAPQTQDGQHLLAHELAHVVQQGRVTTAPERIAPPGDVRERAAVSAAQTVTGGGTAHVASAGSAMVSLERDTRLERFLGQLPAIANESASLTPAQQVERIIQHFIGVNLRDRDNYTPVADAVAKYFPEVVLIPFLEAIDRDVRVAEVADEQRQMQARMRMLQVKPRGAYKTVTPFPMTEIVMGGIRGIGGHIVHVIAAFLEGVIEGLGGSGSDQLIADLLDRLKYSAVLTAVAPVIFAAGAVVGILGDFWRGIKGLWELITNFSEMLQKFRELFNLLMSPAGPAFSREMGRHVGQEWRGQLKTMATYGVFRFTYEMGKLIGPSVVYAVLTLLGITAPAVISAIATRFASVLARFPAAMNIIRRIGSHLPKRRRSPIAAATDAEIDAALDAMTSPKVKGIKKPRIDDVAVPPRPPRRLDLEDIPRRAGEKMRDALKRVRQIIGRKLSDIPEIRAAWDRARAHILSKNTLTEDNYLELYNKTRDRFWKEVRSDPAAARHFVDAGFDLNGANTTAARLGGVDSAIPVNEITVSLDHIAEKAIGDNWKKAIDADNLEMTFSMPNTNREVIQKRHGMRD